MLEQARFSLARAGVMVGLCATVVLGAGWFMNQREAVRTQAPVHFSARTWQAVQTVLRHVAPANPTSQAMAQAATSEQASGGAQCAAAQPGYERLQKSVTLFNLHLTQLARTTFVRATYQLNIERLIQGTAQSEQTCAELQRSVQWLNDQVRRQGLEFLQSLSWKERVGESAQARFELHSWVSMPKHMLTTRSAWSGLPGCVYGTDAKTGQPVVVDRADSATWKFCQAEVAAQQALRSPFSLWDHVPGLSTLLEPLSAWRMPQHPQYRERVGDDNTTQVGGQKKTVGMHVQLSIDPSWQASLQTLAECFSGKALPACARFATQADGRYEKARVRMAGMAVIDVPTGRLVAAASANSPCYAHDKTRLGAPPADCPNLPEGTVHKPRVPQTLTNHALFTQAPPGSLVKPLLMSGIVVRELAQASLVGLDQAMQRSDSQQFLDAFLCRQRLGQGSFSPSCDRPALTLKSAHRLGWNSGCDGLTDAARAQCGMVDLMHGLPLAQRPSQLQGADVLNWRASDLPFLMGQTLVQPFRSASGVSGYQDMPWPESLPSSEQRKTCATSGAKGYVRCAGPQMAIISEGYGQGNTLATPTGVASLLATLANSSHGQASNYPHVLVDRVGADGQTDAQLQRLQRAASAIGPEGIEPTVARRVLTAMEKTHMPGGTAYSACVRAFGADACSASRGVAGKTGTPGDADERSLSQLTQDMRARAQCRNTTAKNCAQQFPLPRPRYRWYAAVFKSQGSEHYDKAIAVLVHSNWRKSDGRYADDQNAAAEMGMLAIKQFQTAPDKP